jgi:transposase
MIRIDTLWLCSQPQDMRAGADRLLNIVVNVFGAAHAHDGYIFANLRATRIKLLVHDGFGVWCATRRLHARLGTLRRLRRCSSPQRSSKP